MEKWCNAVAFCLVLALVLAMATDGHAQDFWGDYSQENSSPEFSPDDYLKPHNEARAAVGVGPMEWDDQVADYATRYAQQLEGSCQLVHSNSDSYGENLAMGYGDQAMAPADAVAMWVDEGQYYDHGSNSCFGGECRHYTQVVWRDSGFLGCARVKCTGDQGVIVICNYSPPGNIDGEYPY